MRHGPANSRGRRRPTGPGRASGRSYGPNPDRGDVRNSEDRGSQRKGRPHRPATWPASSSRSTSHRPPGNVASTCPMASPRTRYPGRRRTLADSSDTSIRSTPSTSVTASLTGAVRPPDTPRSLVVTSICRHWVDQYRSAPPSPHGPNRGQALPCDASSPASNRVPVKLSRRAGSSPLSGLEIYLAQNRVAVWCNQGHRLSLVRSVPRRVQREEPAVDMTVHHDQRPAHAPARSSAADFGEHPVCMDGHRLLGMDRRWEGLAQTSRRYPRMG